MSLKKFWYNKVLRKNPASMPLVRYWMTKEMASAKVVTAPDGSTVMHIEGEDYPFPTFPRGHILFGKLSKLKHEIKNQVFNEAWAKLEKGEDITQHIKTKLFKDISQYFEPLRYDVVPVNKMTPSVRELHRAWTKVAPPRTFILRDYLCFILQEDDAYRIRVQWLVTGFGWFFKLNPVKTFTFALGMLEHGEVIGDMKERQRLLNRVVVAALQDPHIKDLFIKFFREVNWKKVKLTKGDLYHFRGKYFKADLDKFEY